MKLLWAAMVAALLAPGLLCANDGPQLEGSWYITISFDGTPPPGFPASFPVMHTFIPSGEMLETAALPQERGSGHGAWVRVGPRQFRYTFRFFAKDPTGTIIGYAEVRQWIAVNEGMTKLEGCRFIGDIYAFSGAQLLHSTGSCQGERMFADANEPAAVNVGGGGDGRQ